MKDIFAQNGLPLSKADNNRVQGHMITRSLLDPVPLNDPYVKSLYKGKAPKELPALMFFDSVGDVIEDIQSIQISDDDPSDCAKEPHDITHGVDAIRYFCINRTLKAEVEPIKIQKDPYLDMYDDEYDSYMTGGDITESYVSYA